MPEDYRAETSPSSRYAFSSHLRRTLEIHLLLIESGFLLCLIGFSTFYLTLENQNRHPRGPPQALSHQTAVMRAAQCLASKNRIVLCTILALRLF